MIKYPLDTASTVQFRDDGTGLGSVCQTIMGPAVAGVVWHVQQLVTSTTSEGLDFGISDLRVYRGTNEIASARHGGSWSGDNDVSEEDFKLRSGEKLLFVWRNGDLNAGDPTKVAAYATIVIRGEVEDSSR